MQRPVSQRLKSPAKIIKVVCMQSRLKSGHISLILIGNFKTKRQNEKELHCFACSFNLDNKE